MQAAKSLVSFQNFKGSNFLGGNTKTGEFLCRALIIIDTAHLHSFRILGQPSLLKVPANFQMLKKIFLRWEQFLFRLFFRGVAREMWETRCFGGQEDPFSVILFGVTALVAREGGEQFPWSLNSLEFEFCEETEEGLEVRWNLRYSILCLL